MLKQGNHSHKTHLLELSPVFVLVFECETQNHNVCVFCLCGHACSCLVDLFLCADCLTRCGMDGPFFPLSSTQDSLKGRHSHLSPQTGSGNHVSEEGADAVTPDPEHSAEHSEEEVAEELNEAEEEEQQGSTLDKDEKGAKETKGDVEGRQEDGKSQEEGKEIEDAQRKAAGENKKGEDENNELEEECCEDKDENKDEDIERKEEQQKIEEEECEDSSSEVVKKSSKSDQGGESWEEDRTDKERDELERTLSDGGHSERKEEEVETSSKGGQEEESDKVLERCSLSRRKLTESNEVLERCVQSEGEDTERGGVELEDDSVGQRALDSKEEEEEEVIERFKEEGAYDQPASNDRKMKNVTKNSSLPAEVGSNVVPLCCLSVLVLLDFCKQVHVVALRLQLHCLRGCYLPCDFLPGSLHSHTE